MSGGSETAAIVTVHRYVAGAGGVCAARWGENRCGLPVVSPWHTVEAEVPTEVLTIPLDATNVQSPVEMGRAAGSGSYSWGSAMVRPLDEDVRPHARCATPGHPQSPHEIDDMCLPLGAPAPKRGWEVAIDALRSDGGEVLFGVWPVRKVRLDVRGEKRLAQYLSALDAVDETYSLAVYHFRIDERYRWALLTWDLLYGLGIEALADEIAAQYDDTPDPMAV